MKRKKHIVKIGYDDFVIMDVQVTDKKVRKELIEFLISRLDYRWSESVILRAKDGIFSKYIFNKCVQDTEGLGETAEKIVARIKLDHMYEVVAEIVFAK